MAAVPADKFNLSGQHRTFTCVKMSAPVVPLRFADGKPTGFFVRADDPRKRGGKKPCTAGFVEIDAHETLTGTNGETLYFHPGGGGYNDPVENGQYGHIAAADLAAPPKLKPSENGKPAASSGAAYYIAPTKIPHDMWYKAEVVNGRSGSTYYTYGNPGYDKTFGRGDWTYISWSWVQNGGSVYPDNINHGGGIVRALGKRDQLFMASLVEPIIGYSYGANNRTNGRVTVIYGNANAGLGKAGSHVFGWLVHSYQHQNEPIVPCVRRAAAAASENIANSAPAMADKEDPMARMARNLVTESSFDSASAHKLRDVWRKRLSEEKSLLARMEVLTEMSRADDSQTIADFLELLAKERDAKVREQVILLLPFMRSTATDMKRVCYALLNEFRRGGDERERLRIIDAAAIVPARESVILLREIAKVLRPGEPDANLRFGVADAVFQLMPRMKVDEQLVDQIRTELKAYARRGSFATRARAVRTLAAPAWNERAYLAGLVESETSPVIRDLILKMTSGPETGQ
jgi:hypothetical protein